MNLEEFDIADQPTTPPPVLLLTEEQEKAITLIQSFMASPLPEFRLGGYAGTGKTTIIKEIRARLRPKYTSHLCALTGKACNVLHRKGLIDAQTIHASIYDAEPQKGGGVVFYLKTKLDNKPNLIIVDEASMISTELYRDLRSFHVKLLFVGDPGQLEPVGDNPNLMAHPDFTLSKIHRQAELSSIITFAQHIRTGGDINSWPSSPDLAIRGKDEFRISLAREFDQVICAKNKTRRDVNSRFRFHMDKPIEKLFPGDKIIVLRNNQNYLVFNGMILFVQKVHNYGALYTTVDCLDEIGREFNSLPIWNEPFSKELPKEFAIPVVDKKQLVYADWGYAITCHKSQGSEWDKVLIWDEWMPPKVWSMARWRYTAITRASKELTYCI